MYTHLMLKVLPWGDMHSVHPLNKLRHHPTKVHSGEPTSLVGFLRDLEGLLTRVCDHPQQAPPGKPYPEEMKRPSP